MEEAECRQRTPRGSVMEQGTTRVGRCEMLRQGIKETEQGFCAGGLAGITRTR